MTTAEVNYRCLVLYRNEQRVLVPPMALGCRRGWIYSIIPWIVRARVRFRLDKGGEIYYISLMQSDAKHDHGVVESSWVKKYAE